MRVALTGVSGFIGSVIARHLGQAGHSVTGLVRSTSRRDHIEDLVDRFVVGDHADASKWPQLLEGADCLIHNSVDWRPVEDKDLLANLEGNLLGSIRLLDAARPRQVVFMSSISVHHDMRPRWNGRIDEDHPLRPISLYGACKAGVEPFLWDALFRTGQSTCALRPCGVYGIDPRMERTIGHPIVEAIRAGKPYARPGGGKFVHVEDVAAATVACVGNPDSAGRAYNLVDCYARWADWARITGELLGVAVEIDESSPARPKNEFTKDAAGELGVTLDRGLDGIREHLSELIERM